MMGGRTGKEEGEKREDEGVSFAIQGGIADNRDYPRDMYSIADLQESSNSSECDWGDPADGVESDIEVLFVFEGGRCLWIGGWGDAVG